MKSIIPILFIISVFFTSSLWAESDLSELHQAIHSENPVENIERVFQDPNVNPNAVDKNGNPALVYATVELGKNPKILVQVIRALYKHPKLDPNLPNNDGFTALHMAVTFSEHSQEVIRTLYERSDIKPNTRSNTGATPLLIALNFLERAPGEVIKSVETLFEHSDTHPSISSPQGYAPIDYVKELLPYDSQLRIDLEEILRREIKKKRIFCYENLTTILVN